MEEQLISFETAKLAKEKGFNIPTRNFYTDLSWNSKEIYSVIEVGYSEFTNSMEKEHGFGDIILISTQSLLQKWLREVYNIFVSCSYNHVSCDGTYYIWYGVMSKTCNMKENFKTWEEALEIGLQEALKLIKNE